MQQVLSWRFLATLGALAGLFLTLFVVFGRGESNAEPGSLRPLVREVHLLEEIESARAEAFGVRPDGRSRGQLFLGLRDDREMRIVEGTFGENNCGARIVPGACAVAANLIGDAVVWFSLLPIETGGLIIFPAIDQLDDGRAQLINGLRLPYARVLDRRCPVEFTSYREFRQVLGDRFTSVYSLEDERLVAVVCDSR
jgi:hypothetical protein